MPTIKNYKIIKKNSQHQKIEKFGKIQKIKKSKKPPIPEILINSIIWQIQQIFKNYSSHRGIYIRRKSTTKNMNNHHFFNIPLFPSYSNIPLTLLSLISYFIRTPYFFSFQIRINFYSVWGSYPLFSPSKVFISYPFLWSA